MINVVIFNGGRGARTLIPSLLKVGGLNITSIVNAYDDGKSTGELRRFFRMLGPSDIRKVQETMIPEDHIDYKTIIGLYAYRYPNSATRQDVLSELEAFAGGKSATLANFTIKDEELRDSLRMVVNTLLKGIILVEKAENKELNYGDCSLMNLIFAGAFLHFRGNFEDATIFIDKLFKLKGTVLPTNLEDKKLVAIREDGTILYNEAQIVELRSNSRVKKIYLLDNYPSSLQLAKMSIAEVEGFFEIMNRQVSVTARVERSIRDADIIVYAPGTQHSSLYPSYMSKGLTEAIVNNKRAIKVFITNIGEDYETPSYSASDFIRGGVKYLKMGLEYNVSVKDVISYALVNSRFSGNLENYVKYDINDLNSIGCNIMLGEYEDINNTGKHDGKRLTRDIIDLYSRHMKLRFLD